tara:strand:- start:875 stop:2122 length:1248 start_codon:yes stop_codon:yes gene_type:complete
MSSSYEDNRNLFKPDPAESDLLLSKFTNQHDRTIITNALDIDTFRLEFNQMVSAFNESEYTVNNMLSFYSRYDPNDNDFKSDSITSNYLVNQWKGDDTTPYRNILSDFILDMIIDYINITDDYSLKVTIIQNLDNSVRGNTMQQALSNIESVRSDIRTILQELIDNDIFNLYFHIIGVEKIDDISSDISLLNVYNTKNIIVMNILKYFYLSELLLRVLLDTNENIGGDIANEEESKIHSDYDTTTNHLGMVLSGNEIGDDKVVGKINEVNKILKDIYLIYFLFDKNQIKFDTYFSQSNYETGNSSNTDSGAIELNNDSTKIHLLESDVVDINMNINKLNLKNINIKKNYEKNRNIYFITILFVIVYISINLFVILTKGPDSLLTLNGIIIIVILLTKFSQAIMKVYQNLVKDLKN